MGRKFRKLMACILAAAEVITLMPVNAMAYTNSDILLSSEDGIFQDDQGLTVDDAVLAEEQVLSDEVEEKEKSSSVKGNVFSGSDSLINEDEESKLTAYSFSESIQWSDDEDTDPDALLEGYLNQLVEENKPDNRKSISPEGINRGELLGSKFNKYLYDFLVPKIKEVASGSVSSTEFTTDAIDLSALGVTNGFTKEELGVSDLHTQEAYQKAFYKALDNAGFDVSDIMDALLSDLPYDLYWYDKTKNGGCNFNSGCNFSFSNDKIFVTDLTVIVSLYVSKEYSVTGNFKTTNADTGKTGAAKAAVNTAKSVVASAITDGNNTDYKKMKYYKEYICNAVDYNTAAYQDKNTPYGNPWQLIWVFDGDSSTKVVCEGYSKAFKLLCDLSSFAYSDTDCYLVSGTLSGGTGSGAHMWNLVHMDDGKNYFVDVTNCDSGFSLFLVGYSSVITNGYKVGTLSFTYDEDTLSYFSNTERTINSKNYQEGSTKTDISNATITLGSSLTYNGQEQTQTVSKVTVNGTDLAATDYTVSNNTGKNAGSYTLTVTAKSGSQYTGSATKTFAISRKSITPTVTVSGTYTFTGSAISPTYTVMDANTALTTNDYTAALSDNTNAGTGKLKISAKTTGNYSFNDVSQNFTINKAAARTLSDVTVTQTYTNTSVSASVADKMPSNAGTISYTKGNPSVSGSTTVSSFSVGTSGSVSATLSNTKAGDVITLPVTISSTNYNDSTIKVVVTLASKTSSNVSISGSSTVSKTYGDSSFTLSATAANPGSGQGKWTWTSSNTNAATVTGSGGTGTVTVKGTGQTVIKAQYESDTTVGEASVTLNVNKKSLSLNWTNTAFTYDGNTHKPKATLSGAVSGDTLTVSVSGEKTDAGTYTATAAISGSTVGNYQLPSNTTCSYTINKCSISGAAITLGSGLTYNGSEQTQTVSKVTVNGKDLASTDYTVSDNKGTNAGSYTLTVTAKTDGNYTGSATKAFTISKKSITPTVTISGSYTFTGSAITPSYTVKDGSTAIAAAEYTAALSDNTNAGTGKLRISAAAAGNYSFNDVTQTFTINKAAAQTISDVKVSQTYTNTSVSASAAGKMPSNAGSLTYTAGAPSVSGTTTVSSFSVDASGNVSAALSNARAGDVITLPVTINSSNYNASVLKVVVTLIDKSDAEVSVTESSPVTKTYGDAGFDLHASVKNAGSGEGKWTWKSSNTQVASVTDAGSVKILSNGECVITAHYESQDTVGEASVTLKINKKTLGLTWTNTSFIYDGASHKPTATITGVVSGDDCTVNVTGEQTEIGTYTATASLVGTASSKYILPADKTSCSFTISTIKVTNVKITGTSADPVSMQKGDKIQLGVTITPANATDKTVKWSSSSPAVVTVDDTGLITATAYGTAVITAEANDGSGIKDTLTVKVEPVAVTDIKLRAVSGTVMVPGSNQQIEALISPSNATDKTLVWTSSNESIAKVDNGLVTIMPADSIPWGENTAVEVTITASSVNNVKAEITFTVKKPENPVSSVKIDPKSVKKDAKPGDTFRLTAIIEPDNASDKSVSWKSSNPSVAEIDSTGIVTVKGFGQTVITVSAADGKTGTCELNIQRIPVTGITINKAGGDDYLAAGKSAKLSAVITPDNASVKDVLWSSSDTNVAVVDENGVVTGKAQGKVTITAAAKDDNTKKASIELTVFDDSDTLYVEFAEGSDYPYTGKAITPLINVYNRGRLLMEKTDYTVKFSNNINANDGTVEKKAPKAVVTGKTIAATAEAVFRILPKDIGDETSVSAEEINVAYGKSAAPLLYYGGTKLGSKDFTNPYANDKFTASRAITVYGKGNYTGEREIWINVMDSKEVKSIPKIKILSFSPKTKIYNGQPQYLGEDEIIVVNASDKSKTPLKMNKDFYIAYPDDVTNAGTVKFTVIGMGGYAGSAGKSYKIEAAKKDGTITAIDIAFPEAEGTTSGYDSFEYKPGGVLPAVEILIKRTNGKTEALTAGRDYKVTYKNNVKAGAANKNKPATATITFLDNYKSLGKMTKNFYIDQADLGKAKTFAPDKTVTKDQPKYPMSEPVVDIEGTSVNKKEYTVTYKADGKLITSKDKLYKALKESGDSLVVDVEINAKAGGNYTGTAAACRYRITRADAGKDLSKATVILQKKGDVSHKAVKQLDFSGKPIEIGTGEYSGYELYVYMGKKSAPTVLKEGTDFCVEYSDNVNGGKATILLNGCEGGSYYGSKTFTFKIVKGRLLWIR